MPPVPAAGVPESTPPTRLTPEGSVPEVLVKVAPGYPEAVSWKVPAVPAVKLTALALVNAGA